jgi:SAM-dependent methyltransferase
LSLCAVDGTVDASGAAWARAAAPSDRSALMRAEPPVLDIGCGPGRHVVALAEAGVPALGIDITPLALTTARARGALVLERSVFDRVPGAGRWATALLLDGNIGIGGDPLALLLRVARLVRPAGRVIVEFGAPGMRRTTRTVRLESGADVGPWFDWVDVPIDDAGLLAAAAGVRVLEEWRSDDGRWFACLG